MEVEYEEEVEHPTMPVLEHIRFDVTGCERSDSMMRQ